MHRAKLRDLVTARPEAAAMTPLTLRIGITLLRVMLGIGIAVHGWQVIGKSGGIDAFATRTAELGFPAPTLFAILAKGSELVGGVLLALGLLTRPALVTLVCTMLVAVFVAGAGKPFIGSGGPSRELAMLYLVPFVSLLLTGPGPWSLDALLPGARRAR